MSRNPKCLLHAPVGMNTAYDTAVMPANKCLMLLGFMNDEPGRLRAVGQFPQAISSTDIASDITAILAAYNNIYFVALSHSLLYTAVYVAQANVPITIYPPTFTLLTPISVAVSGSHLRLFPFQGEVYAVNGSINYRFGSSASPASYNLGIPNNLSITDGGTGAGSLTGVYQWFFTQNDGLNGGAVPNVVGRQSSPSNPFKKTMSGTSQILTLPTGSYDPQTKAIDIYRTVAGGAVFYHVTQVSTATGSYTDTGTGANTDASIQANAIGPNFGENSPPPLLSYVWEHQNRIWGWASLFPPTQLVYSNFGSATQFASPTGVDANGNTIGTDGGILPLTNDTNKKPSCGCTFGSVSMALLFTERWIIFGTDSTNYALYKFDNKGCIAPDSLVLVNETAVYMSEDGVWATDYNGTFNDIKLSGDIDATFNTLNGTVAGRKSLESSFGWFADNAYHVAIGGTIWRFDFETKGWSSWTPPAAPLCASVLRGFPGCVETAYLSITVIPGSGGINAFDTHSPNQSITSTIGVFNALRFWPHPLTVEGRELRADIKKALRIRQYGTGTFISGQVYGNCDGKQEGPYPVAVAFNAQGFVIEQEFTTLMTGRVFYPSFEYLSGTNLVLTDTEVDYCIVS